MKTDITNRRLFEEITLTESRLKSAERELEQSIKYMKQLGGKADWYICEWAESYAKDVAKCYEKVRSLKEELSRLKWIAQVIDPEVEEAEKKINEAIDIF